jgi:hypothetical protein
MQWAWTAGGLDDIAIAVDLYATKPNGVTNRRLTGMSPPPASTQAGGVPAAEKHTAQIWLAYFTGTTRAWLRPTD